VPLGSDIFEICRVPGDSVRFVTGFRVNQGFEVKQVHRAFTMMWKRYQHAANNTMELRAVAEALSSLASGMNFGVD
jgi:ribonuclease HI